MGACVVSLGFCDTVRGFGSGLVVTRGNWVGQERGIGKVETLCMGNNSHYAVEFACCLQFKHVTIGLRRPEG